jgi:SH3-like domain-containing protein
MPAARIFLLSLGLLLLVAPGAFAEQSTPATPPSGSLKLPPKKAASEPPHTAPKAAPVAPVHKAGERGHAPRAGQKPTPVVSPKSTPTKHPPHGKPPPAAAVIPAPAPPAAAEAKPAAPAGPPKGTATGLPLPRFAALRSDEVNLRSGPGTRYPIQWVYKRRDLPVEIEREFEVWRLIEDPEGVKGWVHQATLTGRRSFLVTGSEQTLRREAKDDSAAVAKLKPGVVGHIHSCQPGAAWCQVQVGEYRGWLKRGEFWGSYPGEAVNP